MFCGTFHNDLSQASKAEIFCACFLPQIGWLPSPHPPPKKEKIHPGISDQKPYNYLIFKAQNMCFPETKRDIHPWK